jgi:alkylation response protein AidB-like acyl-CoA dehydrogenase
MNLDFTSEQNMLRKSVAEYLTKECPFDTVKEIEDSEEGYMPKHWKKMAELGWMEICIPEKYGGLGDPFFSTMIIMEEMGKTAFVSPYFSTVIQCGFTIIEGGSEDQKKSLLPKIATGKIIMALAQYEEEASYEEIGINMPAVLSGDQYVLNGIKLFVVDANIADKLIVAARVKDAGVTLFLVDKKAPGISVTKMPTMGMDNNCEVIFKDVKVNKTDLIGKHGEGWAILQKMAPKAIVAKCAEMLGGCKAAIDMTAEYAKNRVQYEKPIGGFQAIQHYMANMLLAYDTCVNFLYKVTWMVDEGLDVSKEIHALKAQVNEQYKFISERGVQIHGGVGTTREFNIALFYRRAKVSEYIMGDTEFHYEKLAQALGL